MPRLAIIIETDDPESLYAELNSCKSVKRFDYIDEIEPDVMIIGISDAPPTVAN